MTDSSPQEPPERPPAWAPDARAQRVALRGMYVSFAVLGAAALISMNAPEPLEIVSVEKILAAWPKLNTDYQTLVTHGKTEFAKYYVVTFYNLWNLTLALTVPLCLTIVVVTAFSAPPASMDDGKIFLVLFGTIIFLAILYMFVALEPSPFKLNRRFCRRCLSTDRSSTVWLTLYFFFFILLSVLIVFSTMSLIRYFESRRERA